MFWRTNRISFFTLKGFLRMKKISLGISLALTFITGMLLSFYLSTTAALKIPETKPADQSADHPSLSAPSSIQQTVARFLSGEISDKSPDTVPQANNKTHSMQRIEKGSSLDSIKLTGTIITYHKRLAVFEDLTTRKQHIFKEGETVKDFRILTINRKSVELSSLSSAFMQEAGISPAQKEARADEESVILKKIGPHHYEIAKRVMLDNLKDPARFLKQVRLVPFVINGKSQGFLLKDMKENGFLNEIGLEEGDIITKINGESLNNTFTAIQQFASLGDRESVHIELSRHNKNIILKYTIR